MHKTRDETNVYRVMTCLYIHRDQMKLLVQTQVMLDQLSDLQSKEKLMIDANKALERKVCYIRRKCMYIYIY